MKVITDKLTVSTKGFNDIIDITEQVQSILRNIKLLIEYDGTNFVGWQIQPNGRSVQGEIKKAIKEIINEDVNFDAKFYLCLNACVKCKKW